MENDKDLGDLIFDLMTENYNDKLGPNKDLEDYLKDKSKKDLISLYLLYGYASNNEYVVEDILELRKKKKDEIVKKILNFLDNHIVLILQFLNPKRMQEIKDYLEYQESYTYTRYSNNSMSFDTMKILKQLGFIYCRREPDGIKVHMPKYIRDKINSIVGNLYLEYYDTIISYTVGIVNTYGAIDIEDAFNIIERDVLISFEKYENIIKFISLLELEPFYYSYEFECICSFSLKDEDIEKIIENNFEQIVVYDRRMYEEIGNRDYLLGIKEYKEFRDYLWTHYDFDINEEKLLREEIICDYIDNAQIDENEAKECLMETIDRYLEANEIQKQIIIGYIDKIRKYMPIWKQGGKINNVVQFGKVGRNNPCPCGSGKKYKNCCGRNT